jgi:hypothetical protein
VLSVVVVVIIIPTIALQLQRQLSQPTSVAARVKLLNILAEHGTLASTTNSAGDTPLRLAIGARDFAGALALLSSRIDIVVFDDLSLCFDF